MASVPSRGRSSSRGRRRPPRRRRWRRAWTAASPWKDAHILQNEYITWSRVDKHATRAYPILLTERSKRIAANLGLKEPAHLAKLCLDCHADNPPRDRRGERFKLADGIGCEA